MDFHDFNFTDAVWSRTFAFLISHKKVITERFLFNHMAKTSTTKDLDFYFKHHTDGQSASLPTSISQATIDTVNREVGAIVGNDSTSGRNT